MTILKRLPRPVLEKVLGFLVALVLAVGFFLWLHSDATTGQVVHDAELEYASYSPRGATGGSVVPASCESGVEHWPGDVCGTPVPAYSCTSGAVYSGALVDVWWPAQYGASGYSPRIGGLTQAQCASIGWNWWIDNYTCYYDGYGGLSLRLPLNRGGAHAFWVHADWPRSGHSPIYFSCPVLPVPTITGWSCTMGPGGARQISITWNRAPGYPTVYLRAEQNENTPAFVQYAGLTAAAAAAGGTENYNGSSISFNITPGASYDFWMHTRNAAGDFSDGVGINDMVCNNPPPPTSPTSQCTYDEATDTFTARINWNAPAGYDTFYTRVSTQALGSTAQQVPGAWNDTHNGTTLTFTADRNMTAASQPQPRYYWWVHTRDNSNGWWSAQIDQRNVTPGRDYLYCPLPRPQAVTDRVATCQSTQWSPTNTLRFSMSSRFAQRYDVEYRLRDAGSGAPGPTIARNDIQPNTPINAVAWGAYEWRVRGENQDVDGVVRTGDWSSWDNFECVPPSPVISLQATPALVAKGAASNLAWSVSANYNLSCTITGAGMNTTYNHTFVSPNATTTGSVATPSLSNTTDFRITCVSPSITGLALPDATATARVEVVPILEER